MWWVIQLSLNCVFIARFGSEKNIKIDEHLAKLQEKTLIALCAICIAMILLKDEKPAR